MESVSAIDLLRLPFGHQGPAIYAFINRDNLKIYIGSAVNVSARLRVHRYDIRRGRHCNRHFTRAFLKHPESFDVQIVEQLGDDKSEVTRERLVSREQFWIHFYKSYLPEYGYNLSRKAGSCLGVKHTAEARRNMALSRIGTRRTPEQRLRMSEAQKKAQSNRRPESRLRYAMSRWGKKNPESQKAKVREWARSNPSPRARAVIKLGAGGDYLAGFRSLSDAARAVGNKSVSNIWMAVIGKQPTAFGFKWAYV